MTRARRSAATGDDTQDLAVDGAGPPGGSLWCAADGGSQGEIVLAGAKNSPSS